MSHNFIIPADVPVIAHHEYGSNYQAIIGKTGRIMLFAADQKIEHLNESFFGPNIHPDANNPEHVFTIASKEGITAFATHLGLIARYGKKFPTINYVVKLNSKTNIIPKSAKDPLSTQMWSVSDVVNFKKNSGLQIRGVGFTIYLGSKYESVMLEQAAQMVYQAHQHGLIALLWMYPRGAHVADEKNANLIAGAAGVAASLGADIAKIHAPKAQNSQMSAELLRQAVSAAGNTKLICSGGEKTAPQEFLQTLYDQLHIGGCSGNATGRNIYQNSLADALALSKAIGAIVHDNKTVEQALEMSELKL